MYLTDYIKKCLENPEFRKYWEEDFGDEDLTIDEAIEKLNYIYDKNELYENKEDYKKDLDNLKRNKGINPELKTTTKIEIYKTKNNKYPVIEFLEDIEDEKLKEKTVKNIYELSKLGNRARKPLSRHIGNGIYELRTKFANNIDRIFYFFIFGNTIVMTNGYIKKTQKLDELEFEKAQKYMNNYLKRKGL